MLRPLADHGVVSNHKLVRTRDYSVELQRSGPALLPEMYHNLHLVALVLSGTPSLIRESAAGRSTTRLRAGQSYIRPSGPGASVSWPVGIHCLYIHIHPRVIRRLGRSTPGSVGWTLQFRPRLADSRIRSIGDELYRRYRTTSLDPGIAHGLVVELARHVFELYREPAPPPQRIGRLTLEEVLDALREDTGEWSSVDALSSRAGLTRSYFTRRIRRLTGLSPYTMVAASRIEAAKHWLAHSGLSLAQVAHRAGFADQSHLTRLFRSATGMTPAGYRTTPHKSSRQRSRAASG